MTTDDPFFSPTHRAAPRPTGPRTRLFEFIRADDVPMACDLFDHGEFGYEVQFTERGSLSLREAGLRPARRRSPGRTANGRRWKVEVR
jgi:hypothetical protein